jgi:hypothetical protein
MYLVLSVPDLNYANSVSHEMWMISRPRSVSANETSQYFCGTFMHNDGTQVAIGPVNRTQAVHADADEIALVDLIDAAITAGDRQHIIDSIVAAQGSTVNIQTVLEGTTLAPNLKTYAELTTDGWFPEIEGI